MARYYEINVAGTPPDITTSAIEPATNNPSLYVASAPNGTNDPNALQVELDLFASNFATPIGNNSTITIHGVPLSMIQQAAVFTGATITVKGGMQGGLPLAQSIQ